MKIQNWTNEQKAGYILDKLKEQDIPVSLLEQIQGWLLSGDGGREKEDLLDNLFDEMFREKAGQRSERAYRMLREFERRTGTGKAPAPKRTAVLRRRIAWRVAAVVIPFLILGGVYFSLRQSPPAGTEPGTEMPAEEMLPRIAYATPVDQQKQVVLPDDSKVLLNGGSTVSYPENFGTNGKKIYVEGEVYLHVQKSPDEVFYVQTQHALIEVTGTSFYVRAVPGEEQTVVALHSGSVAVTAGGVRTQLSPLEEFCCDAAGSSEIRTTGTDGWWSEPIAFREQTLPEIFTCLGDYFGTEIRCTEGFDTRRYTIKFDREDTLDQILGILSLYSGSFTYEEDEHGITAK